MVDWSPSQHTIADLRDWQKDSRLEINPDFQRRAVWSEAAKISLIDTILRNIPMPKFLVATSIFQGSTHRSVIDGQQRIRAMLEFISDRFALKRPYDGEYAELKFSELPETIQNKILSYSLDFNEIRGASETTLRDIYSRVNKYNVRLNKQELRRADYPGDFLNVCELLAQRSFLEEQRIFTAAQFKRYLEVEFTSELVLALLEGTQDKKSSLDSAYQKYSTWEEQDQRKTMARFDRVLEDLQSVFLDEDPVFFPIRRTRFRQRADFYSLFVAISTLQKDGWSLGGVNLDPLRDDFRLIDKYTRPSSPIKLLSEYGIRCSTDANSESSRKWRASFLRGVLSGTYVGTLSKKTSEDWAFILNDLSKNDDRFAQLKMCSACSKEADSKLVAAWKVGTSVFQLSNALLVHEKCTNDTNSWIRFDQENES